MTIVLLKSEIKENQEKEEINNHLIMIFTLGTGKQQNTK